MIPPAFKIENLQYLSTGSEGLSFARGKSPTHARMHTKASRLGAIPPAWADIAEADLSSNRSSPVSCHPHSPGTNRSHQVIQVAWPPDRLPIGIENVACFGNRTSTGHPILGAQVSLITVATQSALNSTAMP